jgi:hypothetical protein
MTPELLAFFFGILLLFVAIVGGGFEMRELKVPRVGKIARIASAVAGVFFLAIGLPGTSGQLGTTLEPVKADEPVEEVTTTAPTSVDFTVSDYLGELQITEQLVVHIDGRMVGTLTVDTVHQESSVTVTVPEPGQYDYSLDSQATFDLDGEPIELSGHGEGQINVEEGSSFKMRYEFSEDYSELLLFLEEE